MRLCGGFGRDADQWARFREVGVNHEGSRLLQQHPRFQRAGGPLRETDSNKSVATIQNSRLLEKVMMMFIEGWFVLQYGAYRGASCYEA